MSKLAILWHLHQPEYRDPRTGRPVMPWTRLHALRGYRDLFVETLERDLPVTLNVVPVLLDQLMDYASGITDDHLDLTRVPADALTTDQISTIRATFVCGHPVMQDKHPGYVRLRERVLGSSALGVGELRDLQVWSTLSWFGATALRDHPSLASLQRRGGGFSEDDKRQMLRVQAAILEELPLVLGRVARETRASVSTTPYNHPILPLLIDVRHAARCMPSVPSDLTFAWPEDASLHLERARGRMAEALGRPPVGLWPSEGSVSPEVVALAARAGFRWLATDDGVLRRSARTEATRPGPWDLGEGMVGFFRDHDLSDRVGFRYARMGAAEAVRDLLGTAEERAGGGILSLVLDGENPWEAFPDAGEEFRTRLYDGLEKGPIRGISMDLAATAETVGRVSRLHTGSWIGADFRIWFGHEDDYEAWRQLAACRDAVERSPNRDAALEILLPAEGSDWTWWYGPEFDTPFKGVFDGLFRAHLKAAWEATGEPVPEALDKPIGSGPAPRIVLPTNFVTPRLTSQVRWVHWQGAGSVAWPPSGAMSRGVRHTERMLFGRDLAGCVWLRIDLPEELPEEPESRWRIHVDGRQIDLPYKIG